MKFPAPRTLLGLSALGLAAALLAGCGPGNTDPSGPIEPLDAVRLDYGADPAQYGTLTLPSSDPGPSGFPVAVLIHGGGWLQSSNLDGFEPLAQDLASHGVAVWNLEYRRTRGGGGGYPQTFDDVAAGIDSLASLGQQQAEGHLDLSRVVLSGHSSGGQLAGWAAVRSRYPAGTPGADPVVHPIAADLLAGIFDMSDYQDENPRLLPPLLGGLPEQVPERYAQTSPVNYLPAGMELHAFAGADDDVVDPGQSEEFIAAAQAAGDTAELTLEPGVGHGEWADVDTPQWAEVREAVLAQVRR